MTVETQPSLLLDLIQSFQLSLLAARKADRTVQSYIEGCRQFATFTSDHGMPDDPLHIRREHVEAYIVSVSERWSGSTARNRYKSLQAFFKWAVKQDEIPESPMAHMEPPRVDEHVVPLMNEDQVRALLKTCSGKEFDAVRDTAMIRLMLDSGMRVSELVGMVRESLDDLVGGTVLVMGKGGRQRVCAFGRKTAAALDRYRRMRDRRTDAWQRACWLGLRGPMTSNGVFQMVQRRGVQAGITGLHPHSFRHQAAHNWLADGAQETDLMHLMGWRSRSMLQRYAASAAAQRAIDAHHRLGLMDRI